jgi:uncharacterized membrane protein YidH (DUF202 family)
VLDFGGVIVNDVPTWRADQMPYGGLRDSGNTREGPAYTALEMTEIRSVVISCCRRRRRGAVGVHQPPWLVEVVAVVAFLGGGTTAILGYRQWSRVERAMRLGEPMPAGAGGLVVITTILAIALISAFALVRAFP